MSGVVKTTSRPSNKLDGELVIGPAQVGRVSKVDGLFVVETRNSAGKKETVLALSFAGAVYTFSAEVAKTMKPADDSVSAAVHEALSKQ